MKAWYPLRRKMASRNGLENEDMVGVITTCVFFIVSVKSGVTNISLPLDGDASGRHVLDG